MSSTVFNLLKYIHFVHGFGRKFYTFPFSSLTFKGFWTVVVYPFYEQVNIFLLVHDLDFIYLWILECLSVCSSMVWTLLRGFGHLPSIDIVYSLHACFFFFFVYYLSTSVYGWCLFLPLVLLFLPKCFISPCDNLPFPRLRMACDDASLCSKILHVYSF